ncbi:MAG: voltage-gated potassium channel [Lentimonas sp.]
MKQKLHTIIFGTDTRAGRNFDLVLLVIIILSVGLVMVESVPIWRMRFDDELHYLEWGFTIIFTVEYVLRIWVSEKPLKYIFSAWGLIDLLSIVPTYLTVFMGGYQSIRIIRALRLLRIFRILKLSRFTSESQALLQSLKASYYRIMVFLIFVIMVTILAGTLMYVIEGGDNGFESIPASIYWAIVTITTVGFGDITPGTDLGKFIASCMMILGYVIIAVPTGLISMEMAKLKGKDGDNVCSACQHINPAGSIYCNQCSREVIS